MVAPRKYPDEVHERAVRMVLDATTDAARVAELEREVRELRRANTILRSASAFFAVPVNRELDRPSR